MASKSPPPNGVVLYEGASMIDGAPIVCIATGINTDSTNGKTGALIQTWIMRGDVSPRVAINTGDDASICGDCALRGVVIDGKNVGRRCYVRIDNAPRNTWSTWKRGRYLTAWDEATFTDRVVRLGAYGDPAAVPFHVWQRVLARAAFHTGYTHQWARFPEFAAWVMASCDSAADRVHAKFLGFRTFRVRAESEAREQGEVICPASKEAGINTNCFACHACGGHASKARADIVIADHGPQRHAVNRAARLAFGAVAVALGAVS
jgi:hypothetical protein